MVTLRRDISLSESAGIECPHGEMTDYDRFMLGKRASENKHETFRYRNPELELPEVEKNGDEYHDYMLKQLNRSAPESMVTEEEFYMRRYANSHPAPVRKGFRKMTKAGKIFTTVYVLIVAAIASIIIVANAGGGVSAEAKATGGEIEALAVEDTAVESNSFDRFLDALTNK